MSSIQNDSVDSPNNSKNIAHEIAGILRLDYQEKGAAIKRIEREAEASHHAVRNWYDGVREPSLENFIRLTKASPRLIEWFLSKVGRDDLADIIKAQNMALKSEAMMRDFDIARLIFETEDSGNILKTMQKLTLRQLWFYGQIKGGRKLCAKDLIFVFDISRATAYRDIDELLKLNLLCRVGKGQDEYYSIL